MPLAAVRHGRARQNSGTGPYGYCRRVLWVPGPAGQYSGKIRFIEKPGVEDEGGRHVVKRSSDPRVAHPDVKIRFIEKPGVEDEGGRHVVKRSSDPRVAHPDVKIRFIEKPGVEDEGGRHVVKRSSDPG